MRRPWWERSAPSPSERILGAAGEGRRLIVTARNGAGEPVERVWMSPEVAALWDERIWHDSPFA